MVDNGRYIGSCISEAIDWAQDLLRVSRPIAEATVLSAIQDKAISRIYDGFYLRENDEEVEQRKKASVQSTQKSYNAAKKWSRIHFRNQNRNSGKNSLSAIHKQAASKFSNAAEDMLSNSSPAALPSSSIIDDEENS